MRDQSSNASAGVAYALGAYGIWGLTPIYWKALAEFPAPELLAHSDRTQGLASAN